MKRKLPLLVGAGSSLSDRCFFCAVVPVSSRACSCAGGESFHDDEEEQDDQVLTLPDPETLTVEELRQLLATEEFVMALQSGEDTVLVL